LLTLLFSTISAACLSHATGAIYEIGPTHPLQKLADVPWSTLAAGDQVLIHWSPEPYREKLLISATGTPEKPVRISGVAAPNGELPVLAGDQAITAVEVDFPGDNRAVIKIGAASSRPDAVPQHILIENLEVSGARPGNHFSRRDGTRAEFLDYAAAVWVQNGSGITIRNCVLRDSANGLLSSPGTHRLIIERCYFHSNGLPGRIHQHNTYTESLGITFQFNRFGPLAGKSGGNALKDRSAGTVVRYNWIEGGSRLLDLVDSAVPEIQNDPSYGRTHVYGNVLLKQDDGLNNQICQYGGDTGDAAGHRRGTLLFYHNTVVSWRPDATVLFRAAASGAHLRVWNNIFHSVPARGRIAIIAGAANITIENNWLKTGWKATLESGAVNLQTGATNVSGLAPDFTSLERKELRPLSATVFPKAGTKPADLLGPDHEVTKEYQPHRQERPRRQISTAIVGAFEAPP
jgi:hypothetical protein